MQFFNLTLYGTCVHHMISKVKVKNSLVLVEGDPEGERIKNFLIIPKFYLNCSEGGYYPFSKGQNTTRL